MIGAETIGFRLVHVCFEYTIDGESSPLLHLPDSFSLFMRVISLYFLHIPVVTFQNLILIVRQKGGFFKTWKKRFLSLSLSFLYVPNPLITSTQQDGVS